MVLSRRSLTERRGLRFFITWPVIIAAVLLAVTCIGTAATEPTTVADIALYQGANREKILIEGAKKEGQLTFYATNSWVIDVVTKEFGKKYPFIRVTAVRYASTEPLVRRVIEEYNGGRFDVDAVEGERSTLRILHKQGIFQEFYSPEAANYPDEVKINGKKGVYLLGHREIYNSLGFNTAAIPPSEAPKNFKDLLDPRWKGRMSVTGSSTGVRWIGNIIHAMGIDYLEKLSRQNIRVQNIAAGALGNLVASGEVPLSPTITSFTISNAKKKGAPVEWRPLEPVLTGLGLSGIASKAPHPHAALLFLDYLYSEEGQKVVMKGDLNSPRKGMGGLVTEFKKDYIDTNYSLEEYEEKYNEWTGLLKKLFMSKR